MQKIEPKPWGEQEAYNKLSALCARQECCLSDLAVKMTKKGMDNQSIDRILRQLEEEGFVNEERYSRAFVHDKLMFSHWGGKASPMRFLPPLWKKSMKKITCKYFVTC